MMLSMILFDVAKKREILITMALALGVWTIHRWAPLPELTHAWSPPSFPQEAFKTMNFLGAFLISALFLNHYRRYLMGLKSVVVEELNNSKLMKTQLEEAQRLAKVGNWAFDIERQLLEWSREQYNIFEIEPHFEGDLFKAARAKTHPEDMTKIDQALGEAIKSVQAFEFEHRLIDRNGDYKFVIVKGEVICDSEGTPVRLFGTSQDVSEQKRISNLLSQQQMKMISNAKMASLGEMDGGVAHEINNPLAIIYGKANQVIREISERDPIKFNREKAIADINKILQTTDRIAKIIKGLRSFSRNSEKDPMNLMPVRQILEEVLDLSQERFKHYSVDLKISVASESLIQCRPSQIGQVILNLISNAFDAVLPLPEKWVRVEASETPTHIEITVTDSGQGIPSNIVDKIMQPFFTTKDIGKGTGLGLSISRGIIEEHRGHLYYQQGFENTRFVLTLPKKQSSTLSNA
jgi:C4-dicarboxylate-specific signal transduction histidine kinase